MSNRRLVQRSRQNDDASPASRSRQQPNLSSRRVAQPQLAALPPYEPPSCPLSVEARRELDQLRVTHDYSKYKQNIRASKASLISTTADAFDRVVLKKENAERATNRRIKSGEDEPSEEEINAKARAEALEAKVQELRERAEKSMRDLIDFEDELAMNDTIMKDVVSAIPPPPLHGNRGNRVRVNDDGEEEEELVEHDSDDLDATGVSTLDLLKNGKTEYRRTWTSKPMRIRYENTDYATFIRTVHDSEHGNDIPIPHARTWFGADDKSAATSSTRRRTKGNNDDSDDDIEVTTATVNLKCPLTLKYFKTPYSNKMCKHTFEKDAILGYWKDKGEGQFVDGRGRRSGPKKVECPQAGCEKLLEPSDFYEDEVLARQVKRALQKEARDDEEEDDDDEDDDAPRGTQRSRPTQIGSDDDVEVEDGEDRRQQTLRLKRERAQSRGLSMAPSMPVSDHDDEEEEEDVEMEG